MSLDNYDIIEEIDQGSNGIVYRALDQLGLELAIKKIPYGIQADNEVKMHSKIDHLPYIPNLYESFIQDKHTYIVMQLIKSESSLYQSWLKSKSWQFVWMTIYHTLRIIQDLHGSGFYHGDLHPYNLIWDTKKLWLIDFDSVELIEYEDHNMSQQHLINNGIRSDYDDILNKKMYNLKVKNDNHCFDRYSMLYEFSKSIPCEGVDSNGKYITDSEYVSRLIEEYERIDLLKF